MARFLRSDLGRGHSSLRPPAVVGEEVAFYARPIQVYRAAQPPRRDFSSRLFPPVVVEEEVISEVFPGPQITLALPKLGKTLSRLSPPVVIGAGYAFYGPGIRLAQSFQGKAKSQLRPPAVAATEIVEVFTGPQVVLTSSRRGTPRSFLHPPVIPVLAEPIHVALALSVRGLPKSALHPPQVVAAAVSEIFSGPQVNLGAASKRGELTSRSFLRPPVVVEAAPAPLTEPIRVLLAISTRGLPKSRLSLPAVVFPASTEVFVGPQVTLAAPSERGEPVSHLLAPVVVGAGRVNPGLRIKLATPYVGPVRVHSHLRGPVVIVVTAEESFGPPAITLAYSMRGKAKPTLRPASIVFLAVELFGPKVTLVPSHKGVTHSRLGPPVIVFTAIELSGPEITLAQIKPARTIATLPAGCHC